MYRFIAFLLLGTLLSAQTRQDMDVAFRAVLLDQAEQDFTVGLALGAGAAKGLAHIGVLQALEEAGIRIDMVAGSSMGSVIGGGVAVGLSPDSLAAIALRNDARDVVRLLDPILFSAGLIDGVRIRNFLEEIYGGPRKIEDLTIPYKATTVDLKTGRLYIIDRGDLVSAIRASISVPVVFSPVKLNDMLLVDGGIVEPVPVQCVRDMGADFVIAVNVLANPAGPPVSDPVPTLNADDIGRDSITVTRPRGYRFRQLERPLSLAEVSHSTYTTSMALIAQSRMALGDPDLILNIDAGISAWNFLEAQTAIDRGYQAAASALEAYRRENPLPDP